MRLAPGVPAIAGAKDAAAGEHESRVLTHEVDVVDGVVSSERPLDPGRAAVLGIAEQSTVAAYPTSLRIHKIYGVQIFPAQTNPLCRPPGALRLANSCHQQGSQRKYQDGIFRFTFHHSYSESFAH